MRLPAAMRCFSLHRPRLLLLLGPLLPLAGCGARDVASVPGAPVVLISIDTLRADHLPAYGYRAVETPNLDRLAGDAAVFERCLSHSPQTLPSHATLFTGFLPFATGVRDNAGFRLKEGTPTLASALAARGYRTAGFVSTFVLRAETGVGAGFAVWDDEVERRGPRAGLGAIQRSGPRTVERALAWLAQVPDGQPFLLFVHLYEPHTPYEPPEPYRSRYLSAYDGEIAAADSALGPLLEELRRRGLYERSLVVLLSDHGEGLGDHGEAEHGLFLYEEATRVPLFLKPPGADLEGRRVPGLASLADVAPTILALVGAEPMAGGAGEPLVKWLRRGRIPERTVYAEALYGRYHFGWSELTSASEERFRHIRAPRQELYDLVADPRERDNLAEKLPDETGRLGAWLDRTLAGATPDAPAPVAPEEAEKLQALGYLGGVAPVEPGARLPDPKDRVEAIGRYRRALEARKAGELGRAVQELEALLVEEARMADAWESLARIQLDRGQFGPALEAVGRLRALAPGRGMVHILAASVLRKAGRPEDAREAARLALPTEPAEAHAFLARAYLEAADLVQAREHARAAVRANPRLAIPHHVLGVVAARAGSLEEALGHYRDAAGALEREEHVELRSLHAETGDVLARLGRMQEAEREFREEIRIEPRSLKARLGLAALLKAEGRGEEAIRVLRELVQVVAEPEAYAAVSQALARLGETRAAREVLEQGRARYPADSGLRGPGEGAR